MNLRAVLGSAGLIDAGLWERSEWFGVGFLGPRGEPPCPSIGLIFGREPVATWIFASLRRRLGPVDEHGELRVTFVEGDLPGQAPGYTAILAASADPSVHRARRLSASPALSRFKEDFASAGRCLLVPLVIDTGHDLRGLDSLVVETSQVTFRQLREIEDRADPDWRAVVSAAPAEAEPGRPLPRGRATSAPWWRPRNYWR